MRRNRSSGRPHNRCGFLKKRPVSTFDWLITISSVLVADMEKQSMTISIPIKCKTNKGNKTVDTPVLLDSGAGGTFMKQYFAKKHHVLLHKLPKSVVPKNMDGTVNKAGQIDYFTWIQTTIDGRKDLVRLLVTDLRPQNIIFGLPWHTEKDPIIRYSMGTITIPKPTTTTLKQYLIKDKLRKEETKSPAFTIQQLLIEQQRVELVRKDYEENECELRSLEKQLRQERESQRWILP